MRAIVLASMGICAVPLCTWAGASLYGETAAPGFQGSIAMTTTVERTSKGDRLLTRPSNPATEAAAAFVSVEVTGRFETAVTIRDRQGRVLFSADPATQTTVIAKRQVPGGAIPAHAPESADPRRVPSPAGAMPEGCEGAFSPYAAPRMAHVIGRCISAVTGSVQVAALAP